MTLEQNLCGVVPEMLLKLGLTSATLSLNYPLSTLCRMFNQSMTMAQMQAALEAFSREHEADYGPIAAAPHEEGFCLTVPSEGAAYIYRHAPNTPFLRDLIAEAQNPACTEESLIAVFRRHSPRVQIVPMDNAEFDTLVYFEDGQPDAFYYCIDAHDGHVSYHRFSREDYEAFGF